MGWDGSNDTSGRRDNVENQTGRLFGGGACKALNIWPDFGLELLRARSDPPICQRRGSLWVACGVACGVACPSGWVGGELLPLL